MLEAEVKIEDEIHSDLELEVKVVTNKIKKERI